MCDSMAIDNRSRNARPSRSLITLTIHVAVAEAASPMAATMTMVRSPSMTPSVSSLNHSASSASGSIISTRRAERGQEQAGLGAVAEPERAPQRRQRAGQLVAAAQRWSWTTSSPCSSSSTNRDAWSSNIVR